MKKIKRIGVLTRDCAGINAALRAVVRTADRYSIEVAGIYRLYDGLIDGEIKMLTRKSVSGIINQGGTILRTSRSSRFLTEAGQKKALETIKKHKLDGLVVIGGNGSLSGAYVLEEKYGIPVIGVPATIDNDVNGVDLSIGADTAVNVALDAIDKIRDTAFSLERIFVIEVMGRNYGYIASQVALAGGCEDLLIPEKENDLDGICRRIQEGNRKGKVSWIIIVAEGKARASDIAQKIHRKTGLETREAVLGHIQRGGRPTAVDRILASRMGSHAVKLFTQGLSGICVTFNCGNLDFIPLASAIQPKQFDFEPEYALIQMLT